MKAHHVLEVQRCCVPILQSGTVGNLGSLSYWSWRQLATHLFWSVLYSVHVHFPQTSLWLAPHLGCLLKGITSISLVLKTRKISCWACSSLQPCSVFSSQAKAFTINLYFHVSWILLLPMEEYNLNAIKIEYDFILCDIWWLPIICVLPAYGEKAIMFFW